MVTRVYRAILSENESIGVSAEMELAWNTQKNKMTDVKGKEKEQERQGKIRNEDIDRERTKHNYDLVESDKNLYQRVKERVDYAKETGSRVQKNSVVMYSNVLTVSEAQAKEWGEERTKEYFQSCYDYFSQEFGRENVVSAKVHLDESAPHMHLHFVPFNKETGKLQARVAMDKKKINQIHNDLPAFLRERGFDVVRGSGKTGEKNIEDIYEYKAVQKKIQAKENELKTLIDTVPDKKEPIPFLEKEIQTETVKKSLFQKETIEKETGNYILSSDQYEEMNQKVNAAVAVKNDYERLKNTDLAKENQTLKQKNEYLSSQFEEELIKRMNAENERDRLKKENKQLKNKVIELKLDIKMIYLTTRQFLKEKTSSLKAYKSVFKDYLDSLNGNYASLIEKRYTTPKKSEFEVVHDEYEKSAAKKMNRDNGMER